MTRYLDNIFKKSEFRISTEVYSPNPLLEMDIYTAKSDTDRNRAAVVWAHGSGEGASKDNVGWFYQKLGFVTCAIDYRGGDNSPENQKLVASDIDAAIGYLAANASRLGINPNWIIPQGVSFGALGCIHQNIMSANRGNAYFQDPKLNQSNLATRRKPLISSSHSGAANKTFQGLIVKGISPQLFFTGRKDRLIDCNQQIETFNLMHAQQALCYQRIFDDDGHQLTHHDTIAADTLPRFYAMITSTP